MRHYVLTLTGLWVLITLARRWESHRRIGHGYDIHRLNTTQKHGGFVIGGVTLSQQEAGGLKLVAHSDGDVVLHSVADALLGALGYSDIGTFFPDNDPRFRGQQSSFFVSEVMALTRKDGYVVESLDITVIAERPKLASFREQIIANVAQLVEADPSVVNVKARTKEGLDSVGSQQAIECFVVILLKKSSLF